MKTVAAPSSDVILSQSHDKDNLRSWRLVSQGAMRTYLIIFPSPFIPPFYEIITGIVPRGHVMTTCFSHVIDAYKETTPYFRLRRGCS